MVDVCQKCGVRGFIEALNYCEKCQVYPIHRYCLDVLPKTFDKYVSWFCDDCETKEVPRKKLKVKSKKKKFIKRVKKKKAKMKRHDEISSTTKIEVQIGQSGQPLQPPAVADCSNKNGDSTIEKSGEQVQEETNHEEVIPNHVSQPIVDPVWRGSLRFWNKSFHNICLLVAHTSSLACSKVYEEAKLLPELLPVEILRRCDVWPKGFEKLGPTDKSIALYFFPENKSSEKAFDILVNVMMSKDLAMRAVLKNAELLVFTSSMLPLQYWRFQMRYYLWGVFRGKQDSKRRYNAASEEKDLAESLTYQIYDADLGTDTNPSTIKKLTENSGLKAEIEMYIVPTPITALPRLCLGKLLDVLGHGLN